MQRSIRGHEQPSPPSACRLIGDQSQVRVAAVAARRRGQAWARSGFGAAAAAIDCSNRQAIESKDTTQIKLLKV